MVDHCERGFERAVQCPVDATGVIGKEVVEEVRVGVLGEQVLVRREGEREGGARALEVRLRRNW